MHDHNKSANCKIPNLNSTEQVKEPEGFSDKSKKRSSESGMDNPAQRKRSQADKTKPITDFFKAGSSDGALGTLAPNADITDRLGLQQQGLSHLQ